MVHSNNNRNRNGVAGEMGYCMYIHVHTCVQTYTHVYITHAHTFISVGIQAMFYLQPFC